ncbi:membrane-spanning protein, partial [Bacillus wiedmannii]
YPCFLILLKGMDYKMFKNEFQRSLTRKSTLVVLVIVLLIAVFEVLTNSVIYLDGNDFWDYPMGSYSWWFIYHQNIYQSILSVLFPLLVSLGYSDSYIEDIKSGFLNNVLIRQYKSKYLVNKFLVNFIVGGIIVFVPLVVNLLLYLILVPNIDLNVFFGSVLVQNFFPDLYIDYPFIHVMFKIFIFILYGGTFASIGLASSIFIKNRYVVVIIPFLIYTLLDVVLSSINLRKGSPLFILFYDQPYNIIIFIIPMFMLCITFLLFFIGGKFNEEV